MPMVRLETRQHTTSKSRYLLNLLVPKVEVKLKSTESGRKKSVPHRVKLFFQGETEVLTPKSLARPRGRKFPKGNRGDWQKLEPAATVQPFVIVFMQGPDPHLTRIVGIAG